MAKFKVGDWVVYKDGEVRELLPDDIGVVRIATSTGAYLPVGYKEVCGITMYSENHDWKLYEPYQIKKILEKYGEIHNS
jgi:hypothetical protein